MPKVAKTPKLLNIKNKVIHNHPVEADEMVTKNKMKIELTKKQYETLAKAVYLGNWIANAQRTGSKDDPHMKEYDEIADYIFSFAKDFGFPDDFEAGLEFSDGEEESPEASRLREEYDEQNFWEVLPEMLGERDFYKKYTSEQIMAMSDKDRFMKRMECETVWGEEFEKYGVERLKVEEGKK